MPPVAPRDGDCSLVPGDTSWTCTRDGKTARCGDWVGDACNTPIIQTSSSSSSAARLNSNTCDVGVTQAMFCWLATGLGNGLVGGSVADSWFSGKPIAGVQTIMKCQNGGSYSISLGGFSFQYHTDTYTSSAQHDTITCAWTTPAPLAPPGRGSARCAPHCVVAGRAHSRGQAHW